MWEQLIGRIDNRQKDIMSSGDAIFCPFCNGHYVKGETRLALAGCEACKGQSDLAEQADADIDQALDDVFGMADSQEKIEILEKLLRLLAPSYVRSEIRSLLTDTKKRMEKS